MDPEKVFSMCSEGSLDITNSGKGGMLIFIKEDARHALAGMTQLQQYYTEYVFLLHDTSLGKLTRCLTDCVRHDVSCEYDKLYRLCRVACVSRRKPNVELLDSFLYKTAKVSRQVWRSTLKRKYRDVILKELCSLEYEIEDHILRMTR